MLCDGRQNAGIGVEHIVQGRAFLKRFLPLEAAAFFEGKQYDVSRGEGWQFTDSRRKRENLRCKLADIVFIGLVLVARGETDSEYREDTGH